MAISEDTFTFWAKPPSPTETERCENAERAIRKAIDASSTLSNLDIKIIPQGSFRNRTNVRGESDVDIGVVCMAPFFCQYPDGMSLQDFGNVSADYTYASYKNDVEQALKDYFGADGVQRGNKAFNIRENTYRIDADATAFFEHRRYQPDGSYISGVELRPDNAPSTRIQNWPEHHYTNGRTKNDATKRRYRALVRVLKNLRCNMVENDVAAAKPILGFLSECLIWNVPNDLIGNTTYTEDLRAALIHLYNATKNDQTCGEWGEVNELKFLFRGPQRWTRQQANDFLSAAWNHAGLK